MSTFAEQPSHDSFHDALQVVVEDLDDRMKSQHVVGEERRRARLNGGCGSRTRASGDRLQRVGFSRSAADARDQADGMDLRGSAAAYASSWKR